jgi:hypothetical protein
MLGVICHSGKAGAIACAWLRSCRGGGQEKKRKKKKGKDDTT